MRKSIAIFDSQLYTYVVILLSPDIVQNSDGGISDFRISGQSLIKENYHNSRTSHDIDMNFGPVPKIDKRNNTTSTKLTMMSCQQILMSLYSGRILSKTFIFISNLFDLTKTEKRTKKLNFSKKMLASAKLWGSWY